MFFFTIWPKGTEGSYSQKKENYKNSNKLRQRVESPEAGNTAFFDAGTSQPDGRSTSAVPFSDTGRTVFICAKMLRRAGRHTVAVS